MTNYPADRIFFYLIFFFSLFLYWEDLKGVAFDFCHFFNVFKFEAFENVFTVSSICETTFKYPRRLFESSYSAPAGGS